MDKIKEKKLWDLAQQQADQAQYSAAESTLKKIKKYSGENYKVLFFLGEMSRLQGQVDVAFRYYQHAARKKPSAFPPRQALSTILMQAGHYTMAFQALKPMLLTEPTALDQITGLINHAIQAGKLNDAEIFCQEVMALCPKAFQWPFLLGEIHRIRGAFEQAVLYYQQALKHNPDSVQVLNNLGIVCQHMGYLKEAERHYLRALSIEPSNTDFMINLSGIYTRQKKNADAASFLQEKLKQHPDCAALKGCLARTLHDMGLHDQALNLYRESLKHFKKQTVSEFEHSQYHGGYLSFLNYPGNQSKDEVFKAHLDWEATHGGDDKRLPQEYHWYYRPDRPESSGSHQKLRIGYVSADFRQHSVAYFLKGLFTHHDKDKVSVYAYMSGKHQDNTTETLKKTIDHWRVIHPLSIDQIAAGIRADEIDVLIDLSGFTADNRLEVFTRKPAPVQITWLGYPNTTGLSAIDYRITDAWADPEGEERWHSEQLLRLPHGFLCYGSPDNAPDIAPLPAQKNGYITYGSFNSLTKHNDRVIQLWSQLLKAQPKARLILKNASLNDAHTAQSLKQRFQAHGIDEQLELIGRIPEQQGHLALYGRIDIALDTFPYNGTTTTCEALWMGVPVIALEGDRHAGRVGVSLLNQIGHPEWIAKNEDDYIDKVIALGDDLMALGHKRQALRSQMQHSPLSDPETFAKVFEATLVDSRLKADNA